MYFFLKINFGCAATLIDNRRQAEINFGYNFLGNYTIFPCKLATISNIINIIIFLFFYYTNMKVQ